MSLFLTNLYVIFFKFENNGTLCVSKTVIVLTIYNLLSLFVAITPETIVFTKFDD